MHNFHKSEQVHVRHSICNVAKPTFGPFAVSQMLILRKHGKDIIQLLPGSFFGFILLYLLYLFYFILYSFWDF